MPEELCDWISSEEGPCFLTIDSIFVLIDSYLLEVPPPGYSFIPTLQNVFGVIDYYLGFNGDLPAGCDLCTVSFDMTVRTDEAYDTTINVPAYTLTLLGSITVPTEKMGYTIVSGSYRATAAESPFDYQIAMYRDGVLVCYDIRTPGLTHVMMAASGKKEITSEGTNVEYELKAYATSKPIIVKAWFLSVAHR